MTAVVKPAAPAPLPVPVRKPWDPFALMDRLDDEAILKELEGIASEDLVYVVKDASGKEIIGLSKGGIDECCNVLAHRGEVIRELTLDFKMLGEGDDQEALFTASAARFAVSEDGREVKLDQVLGSKTQALYSDAALPLTLDSPCPGRKPVAADGHRRTFREMMDQERGYVEWMAGNFKDEATAEFCRRILAGEDVTIQPGRQKNRFWYEQGSMKAARNARARLVSADIKAQVIARAKQAGKVREVTQGHEAAAAAPVDDMAQAITSATPYPGDGPVKGKPITEWPKQYLLWLLVPGRKVGPDTEIWQSLAQDELKRRAQLELGQKA